MISPVKSAIHNSFDSFFEQDLSAQLLRFTTAGSVDDGKSTFIGRLLHDSKAVYEDQLASVKKSRINRSTGPIDFSLLTDGLKAEREQGITIDVAYRYFATSRRKFIIADTPGHEQYTRNMATGASTADLAVILIDGTKGLLPQTRRHAFIASLLGISNVLAAVNKMDLAGYREDAFLKLQDDFQALAAQLGIPNVQCIPISALEGDNVVDRSKHMLWYQGPMLLEHLETVPLPEDGASRSFRFPVQWVIRPDANFRGFAGRVAGGVIRPGDAVVALPSGRKTHVHSIVTYDGDLPQATSSMSVTLRLADEIDLSRGDMLVAAQDLPRVSRRFHASVVWLHATPLELGRTYLIKHTSRQTKIRPLHLFHRVNINTLAEEPATRLEMNEIGSLEFETHVPLFFDTYSRSRTTGSFILIDPVTNATVGAGMIREGSAEVESVTNTAEERVSFAGHETPVASEERYKRHGHFPAVVFLEDRRALAEHLERQLFDLGFEVLHLNRPELTGEEFPQTVRVAQAAGLIALYSGPSLAPEAKEKIASEFDHRSFDLSAAPELQSSDELASRHVIALAQSRWLLKPRSNQQKVN